MSKPDLHLVTAGDEIERQFRSIMRRLPAASASSPPAAATIFRG
jgi:hypothetical protein